MMRTGWRWGVLAVGLVAWMDPACGDDTGSIRVRGAEGVRVFVDDAYKGRIGEDGTLLVEDLSPGTHRIRLRAPGREAEEAEVVVEAGATLEYENGREPEDGRDPPPDPDPGPTAGYTALGKNAQGYPEYRHEASGIVLVLVHAAEYRMGSLEREPGHRSDERAHLVRIQPYLIGKTEVTNAQFRRFEADHHSGEHEGIDLDGDDHPAVFVSWDRAEAFAAWAGMRLPTEAEWEYVARGLDGRVHPWGSERRTVPRGAGNFADASGAKAFSGWQTLPRYDDGFAATSPVGRFAANPFGLHDLGGNVWEWCADWYGEFPKAGVAVDPAGPSSGDERVIRGGAWLTAELDWLRCAYRGYAEPETLEPTIGFRVARSAEGFGASDEVRKGFGEPAAAPDGPRRVSDPGEVFELTVPRDVEVDEVEEISGVVRLVGLRVLVPAGRTRSGDEATLALRFLWIEEAEFARAFGSRFGSRSALAFLQADLQRSLIYPPGRSEAPAIPWPSVLQAGPHDGRAFQASGTPWAKGTVGDHEWLQLSGTQGPGGRSSARPLVGAIAVRRSKNYLFVSSLFVEEDVLAQGEQAFQEHARRVEEVAKTFRQKKE